MCPFCTAEQSQSPKQAPEVSPHSLNVDVDLVLATVTVTDRNGRFVTGLEKENFKLAEDKVPQEIPTSLQKISP